MKKALTFLGIALILSGSLFLFSQANRTAWRDFRVLIGIMDNAESGIQQLYNQLINIESEGTEILDNPQRKAELKKIIDIHPDYTIGDIISKINKLKGLKQHLKNSGYIE